MIYYEEIASIKSLVYRQKKIDELITRHKQKNLEVPPLSSFSEEAQNSISFLSFYTELKMSTKDINSLKENVINTKEFIFNLLSNGKNLDILLKIKPELKDNDFCQLLEQTFSRQYLMNDYAILKYLPKYYIDKKLEENKNYIEQEVLKNPLNLLYVKNFKLQDSVLKELIINRRIEALGFNYIYKLRSNEWWESESKLLKEILDIELTKSSINIDEMSENIVLKICSKKTNIIPKYFKKYGYSDENAKKIIAFTLTNIDSNDSISERLLMLNEINTLVNSSSYYAIGNRERGFQLFKSLTGSHISKIVSVFEEDFKESKLLDISKENNFIALSYFFYNPYKFTSEEKDKYISYVYKNVDYCDNNKKDLLKNILDFNDQSWGNEYKFNLTPVFAERWNENISDLKKISLDNFYDKFMIKEELKLIYQTGIVKSEIQAKKHKF